MPAVLKRPAAAPRAAAPAAKKAKPAKEALPKRDPLISKVAEGLEMSGLPASARDMLDDMLDHSLTVFKEQRHDFQSSVVESIAEAFATTGQDLQAAISEVEQRMATMEETKAACRKRIEESEAQIQSRLEETTRHKHVLAESAKTFRSARDTVDELLAEQHVAERELRTVAARKVELQTALEDSFKPLLAEGAPQEQGQEKVDQLVEVLNKFAIDKSMMSALPTALVKEPAARGPFDMMVLSQLDQEVAKQIATFEAALREAEPSQAARAEKLEAAKASFEEAKKRQLDAATAYTKAKTDEDKSVADRKEAQGANREALKQARSLDQELAHAQIQLSRFREGPQAAFEALRDLSAPPPPAEPVPMEEELAAGDPVQAEAVEETAAPAAIETAVEAAA